MLHLKLHFQHRDRFYLDPPIRPLYPRLNRLTVTYTVVTKLYVWHGPLSLMIYQCWHCEANFVPVRGDHMHPTQEWLTEFQ